MKTNGSTIEGTTVKWRPSKLMKVQAQLTTREFEWLLQLKQQSGETTTNIVRAALREYAGKVLTRKGTNE